MNIARDLFLKIFPRTPLYMVIRSFERRKYIRRYGYENPLLDRGPLPRLKDSRELPKIEPYRPKDIWHEKRSLIGQNDYIDILGEGNIHPTKVLKNIPYWLKGFQGNEYQMLLRKRKAYSYWRKLKPERWNQLNKRIMYLYRFLNRKTPSW